VIHQTLALLRGLIDRIDKKFLEEGGIKEQRFQARLKYRSNNQRVIRDSKEIKDSREVKDSRDFREISNDSHNPNNPNIPNDPNDPNNPNHHP
jgi:four helix bundle suffix protein